MEDDGPGFPPALLPRIFDPYAAGEPERKRRKGGVGLGLVICKAIVEAHGGTIELDAGVPGKTAVIVTLPRSGAAA